MSAINGMKQFQTYFGMSASAGKTCRQHLTLPKCEIRLISALRNLRFSYRLWYLHYRRRRSGTPGVLLA